MRMFRFYRIYIASILLVSYSVPLWAASNAENAVATRSRFAILRIAEPEKLHVFNQGGPAVLAAALSGVVGATIAATAQNETNSTNGGLLTNISKDMGSKYASQFAADLLRAFQKSQIAAVYLPDQYPALDHDNKNPDYTRITSDADYLLDAYIVLAGYRSGSMDKDYHPFAVVRIWIIDPKTQTRVFQKLFNVGWDSKTKVVMNIPGGDGPLYRRAEDIFSDRKAALDGIGEALRSAANHIPSQLP